MDPFFAAEASVAGGEALQSVRVIAEIVKNATQALAVVVGGIWAYFKFFRGRTFSYRAELAVKASIEETRHKQILHVEAALRNRGLSKIELEPDLRFIKTYAVADQDFRPGKNVAWGQHLLWTDILQWHSWVEPQETITDEILIAVPTDSDRTPAAVRIHAEVWGKRRRLNKKGVRWSADTVVLTTQLDEAPPPRRLSAPGEVVVVSFDANQI